MPKNIYETILLVRSALAFIFMIVIGVIWLQSQNGAHPLSIDDVQRLLLILIPYFALDSGSAVGHFVETKKNKEKE